MSDVFIGMLIGYGMAKTINRAVHAYLAKHTFERGFSSGVQNSIDSIKDACFRLERAEDNSRIIITVNKVGPK